MKQRLKHITYDQRAEMVRHPLSKQLFQLMIEKESNLIAAADLNTCEGVLHFAQQVGPYIGMLKTHVDIIEDFNWEFVEKLKELAEEYQFLLFEDRKFADIGHTVKAQYGAGPFKIVEWAHLVNAHSLPGSGLLEGLKAVKRGENRGLLLIAEMSSSGNMVTPHYIAQTQHMAQVHKDFVIGFIAQNRISYDPEMLHVSPGVRLTPQNDTYKQRYRTPDNAIIQKGADMIVVGRGLYKASNPAEEAKKYQKAGWDAYLKRLNTS